MRVPYDTQDNTPRPTIFEAGLLSSAGKVHTPSDALVERSQRDISRAGIFVVCRESHGSGHFSRVGSGQRDPTRYVIAKKRLNSTRDISNTS